MEESLPLTRLLQAAQAGDRSASESAYAAVYDELRDLARIIRSGRRGALETTALVHEAWIKLAASPGATVENRVHFKRIAGRAMRQVLVEEARAHNALKRGGGEAVPVTFEDGLTPDATVDPVRLLDLDRALHGLAEFDARAAQVVECRFFGAMDVKETAAALGISEPTVKRDWRVARAWLARALA